MVGSVMIKETDKEGWKGSDNQEETRQNHFPHNDKVMPQSACTYACMYLPRCMESVLLPLATMTSISLLGWKGSGSLGLAGYW